MSRTEKLKRKLVQGTIDGRELVVLLRRSGWYPLRQRGSHQIWSDGKRVLVIIAGRTHLKRYQVEEARQALGVE